MDMVRSMLKIKSLPKIFWAEAVNWCVHVLNICLTKSVRNMTPEEAWSGYKPDASHLRVFGCIAYAHIPNEKRKKLDDKSEVYIFIGYSDNSKTYRLYNPITKKIVNSRDVTFAEDKIFQWAEDKGKVIPLTSMEEGEEVIESSRTQNEAISPRRDSSPTREELLRNEASSSTSEVIARPKRTSKQPSWMRDFVVSNDDDDDPNEIDDEISPVHFAFFTESDPVDYESAARDEKWQKAMQEEINSIEKNNTWKLVDLPKGHKPIGVKWVYKTKVNANGEVEKYKARLVVKGYKQKAGIDYDEVFAPVARQETIRLVLSLAAQNSWSVFQLDVKSAFLHGDLLEEVYVEQPPGFIQLKGKNKVYKLNKALYGLKQAPRAWYSRIDTYFENMGFIKCPYEHTLYVKYGKGDKILIICLYVDDLIYTGNDQQMIDKFKQLMEKEFDMTDIGLMNYYLGIEVDQSERGIFISQKKYLKEVLQRFQMEQSKPANTPVPTGLKLSKDNGGKRVYSTLYKQIVGSLMYLTATRPDIMYAVSLISRYMESPREVHLQTAKRILRYLNGTRNLGILYTNKKSYLAGFTDSDYAGDLDDRKSTSGYVFFNGDGAISWSSKKQPIVTLSTTEAEYIAATACACQAIWLKNLLKGLDYQEDTPIQIFCDNNSAIALAKNPIHHGRSKHIDVRYHFIRNLVKKKEIELVYCRTSDQVADIFTKPLKTDVFIALRNLLGLSNLDGSV